MSPFFASKKTLDNLFKAATKGDLRELALLLRHPIHISEITHDMSHKMVKPQGFPPSTPLHAAITSNHMACVLLLAQSMPPPQDPKAPDFWGRPPLLWAIAYNQSDMLVLMMAMGFSANSVIPQHLETDIPRNFRENNEILPAFKAYFEFHEQRQASLLEYSIELPIYGQALQDLIWHWDQHTQRDFFEFTAAEFLKLAPLIENLLKFDDEIQKANLALRHFIGFILQSMLVRIHLGGSAAELIGQATYLKLLQTAKLPEKTLKSIETARAQAHLVKGNS